MKITGLEIRNFLTISEAKLSLSDKGLVLIQGENLDDPSAKSNGAGKSSIPDALCWALYGTTARGITGDAVVNKVAKKNCMVSVEIEDGDDRYKIMRFRKDKHDKNAVLVYKGSKNPAEVSVDLSRGTDRETQEVINAIIGASEDVFRSSVYAGQESMPDLPGMTDKFLKLLIEEAAGVERLSKAYDIARGMVNDERNRLGSLVSSRSMTELNLKAAIVKLDEAKEKAETFERERAGRSNEYKEMAKKVAEVARAKVVKISKLDESAIRIGLASCDKKLEERDRQNKELDALQGKERTADRAFSLKMAEVEAEKRSLARLERELATVSDKVGKPCGECGKPYHEEDIHGAKAIAEAKVAEARETLRKVATEAKWLKTELDVATGAVESFKARMDDFSVLLDAQRGYRNQLEQVEQEKRELETLKTKVAQSVEASKAELTVPNPYTSLVEAQERSVKSTEEALEGFKCEIAACEERCEDLDAVAKVFGPAGVRARILDTVTPFLNDRTSDYLGALSDGNITAVWSTLTRTKGGDLKEKFAIDVTNDKGAETFAGLSGGEKRKVRLATTLALQDLVASRATKPVNLFIGDEIDDALDTAGLERLMTILERKARERGTVLVISHNDLADWCDNIATVTKKGGVSTVDGAL